MPAVDRALKASAGYFITLSDPSLVLPYEIAFKTTGAIRFYMENVEARVDSNSFTVTLLEGIDAPTDGTVEAMRNFDRAMVAGGPIEFRRGITPSTGGIELTGRTFDTKNNENIDLNESGRPTILLRAETWYVIKFAGTSGAIKRFTLRILGDV